MVASTAVSQLLARWEHFYRHTPVSASVTYLHLVGILVGGGVAVAADRAARKLSNMNSGSAVGVGVAVGVAVAVGSSVSVAVGGSVGGQRLYHRHCH